MTQCKPKPKYNSFTHTPVSRTMVQKNWGKSHIPYRNMDLYVDMTDIKSYQLELIYNI